MAKVEDKSKGSLQSLYDDETDEKDARLCRYWMREINAAGRARGQQRWEKRANEVLNKYRNERENEISSTDRRKMNMLWSNTETLKPAIFSKEPVPVIERRFKDSDPRLAMAAREAGLVMERCVSYMLDEKDALGEYMSCRDDYLLVGRAVARVRYTPTTTKETGQLSIEENGKGGYYSQDLDEDIDPNEYEPKSSEDGQGLYIDYPYDRVVWEEAWTEYVPWSDFRHGWGRRWREVPWISYRHFMSRDQLRERFGDEIAAQVPLKLGPPQGKHNSIEGRMGGTAEASKRAIVWEVWDKHSRKVLWLAEGMNDKCLDCVDDPLGLKDFFDCQEPVWSVVNTHTLEPVPEYVLYQDQAEEVNRLTNRIHKISEALKVKGLYAGSQGDKISQLMFGDDDSPALHPVKAWLAFIQAAPNGKLDSYITWLPMDMLIQVLQALYQAREQAKQALYEITGIADIVRGASDPRETAAAQKIKGQYASLRLNDRQRAFARFVRNGIRLQAEVMATLFDPETLRQISGSDVPTQQELQQEAMGKAQAAYQGVIEQAQKQIAQQGQEQGQQPMPPDPMAMQQQIMQATQQAQQLYVEAYEKVMASKPTWEMVIGLLRDDITRSYRIDIETESTVEPDRQADKEQRIEFLTSFAALLERLVMAMQAGMPFDLCKELLLFGVRGYGIARSLESKIEEMEAPQPQGGPSAEEMKKIVAEIQSETQKEIAALKSQTDLQARKLEGEWEVRETKLRGEIDKEIAAMKIGHEAEQGRKERGLRASEKLMDAQQREGEHADAQSQSDMDRIERHETASQDRSDRREQSDLDREERREQFQASQKEGDK